jgi:predicted nucleic acid-binding protein
VIVVTDTSVVLNLCWLKQATLLSAIYQEVLAPPQVQLEFDRKVATDQRFLGLRFPSFITVSEPVSIPEFLAINPALDQGEIAAIALAVQRGITDTLIDEKAARSVAVALGLNVSGLLGILIEGKRRGLVEFVGPLLDSLTDGARFWIDPRLRERVLAAVGEA